MKRIKNIKLLSSLLFAIIFFISCNNKDYSSLEKYFKKPAILIKPQRMSIDSLFIGNVWDIQCTDSLMIILDKYTGYYFTLIDLQNKKVIKRFSKNGRGPNEIIDPTCLYIDKKNNSFQLLLRNPARIIKYNIRDIIKESDPEYSDIISFNTKDNFFFNTTPIKKENKYVATGLFHTGKYGFTDKHGTLDTIIGDFIRNGRLKNIEDYKLGNVYQGIIKSHPDGNKVVCATTSCDLIEVIDTKTYEIKRFYSYLPITKKHKQLLINSRDSRRGYVALQVTSNYIYTVFSGRTYGKDGGKAFWGNKLYVFDWDLNPVCSYSLKHDINCMYVTDDDKAMYSVITLDEPVLVKYDLKHVK